VPHRFRVSASRTRLSRAGVTFGYDANGNQTSSSAGAALAYNAANQTTSLQKGSSE
jgi:hypothetical protein